MIIRILFYKAKFGDKKWLDDAISWWTGLFNWGTGPYSHVELWAPESHFRFIPDPQFDIGATPHDEAVWYNSDHGSPVGTCYTSTMRPPTKGVVKRPASETLKNPERWDYCEIECEQKDYDMMLSYAERRIKKKAGYSFKTVASFFLPWRIHSRDEDICSEFVNDCGVIAEFLDTEKVDKCPSPRRLSRWLTKKGYVIKPLSKGT